MLGTDQPTVIVTGVSSGVGLWFQKNITKGYVSQPLSGSVWRKWSSTLNSSNPGCIGPGATARSPLRSLSRSRFQPRRRMTGEGSDCGS